MQAPTAKARIVAGQRVGAGRPTPRKDAGPGVPRDDLVEGHAATQFTNFAESDGGLQLSPNTVVIMSLVFIAVVILLHIYGKFTSF